MSFNHNHSCLLPCETSYWWLNRYQTELEVLYCASSQVGYDLRLGQKYLCICTAWKVNKNTQWWNARLWRQKQSQFVFTCNIMYPKGLESSGELKEKTTTLFSLKIMFNRNFCHLQLYKYKAIWTHVMEVEFMIRRKC